MGSWAWWRRAWRRRAWRWRRRGVEVAEEVVGRVEEGAPEEEANKVEAGWAVEGERAAEGSGDLVAAVVVAGSAMLVNWSEVWLEEWSEMWLEMLAWMWWEMWWEGWREMWWEVQ
ncbi:hypothetical protein CYMTET_51494 [Cymbomonas tetramitiformis]|uniref:Uncharacterized protein n=1 Tax=Cymbomonas tetramitiformis TaxID=36881 RepID=A0AAE0BKY1_9CHLO|nr:hypothetical protein CYMTET_51494 [Cymbomonas tetramitiformis]